LPNGTERDFHLPCVAATNEQVEAVERGLGEPLDPDYRAFLEHADGWPAFWQTVDVFGTRDLGGAAFVAACEKLGFVESAVLEEVGVRREELLPIASTPVDLDLFVMTRASTREPGIVLWLAGTEVDRFPGFREFFLAITDHNREELARVSGSS